MTENRFKVTNLQTNEVIVGTTKEIMEITGYSRRQIYDRENNFLCIEDKTWKIEKIVDKTDPQINRYGQRFIERFTEEWMSMQILFDRSKL